MSPPHTKKKMLCSFFSSLFLAGCIAWTFPHSEAMRLRSLEESSPQQIIGHMRVILEDLYVLKVRLLHHQSFVKSATESTSTNAAAAAAASFFPYDYMYNSLLSLQEGMRKIQQKQVDPTSSVSIAMEASSMLQIINEVRARMVQLQGVWMPTESQLDDEKRRKILGEPQAKEEEDGEEGKDGKEGKEDAKKKKKDKETEDEDGSSFFSSTGFIVAVILLGVLALGASLAFFVSKSSSTTSSTATLSTSSPLTFHHRRGEEGKYNKTKERKLPPRREEHFFRRFSSSTLSELLPHTAPTQENNLDKALSIVSEEGRVSPSFVLHAQEGKDRRQRRF